jgi:hypothetical protein
MVSDREKTEKWLTNDSLGVVMGLLLAFWIGKMQDEIDGFWPQLRGGGVDVVVECER